MDRRRSRLVKVRRRSAGDTERRRSGPFAFAEDRRATTIGAEAVDVELIRADHPSLYGPCSYCRPEPRSPTGPSSRRRRSNSIALPDGDAADGASGMVGLAFCHRIRQYQDRRAGDLDPSQIHASRPRRDRCGAGARRFASGRRNPYRRLRRRDPSLAVFLESCAKRQWQSADLDHFLGSSALLESRALLVSVFHAAIAAAVTVHPLMTKREAPAAIGWIGMAWLAPVLGALLYVGFGINRVRRRALRLKGSVRSVDPLVTGDISSEDPIERLKAAVGNITGQDMATGKVVAVLECGDQAYPKMLAAIESAKFHVRLSTYIFRTDDVGSQFIDALVRAHRRGVRTLVLIDLAADLCAPPPITLCAGKAFRLPASSIRHCPGRCRSSISDCIRKA